MTDPAAVLTNSRRAPMLVTLGLLLVAAGVGVFVWYRTVVLNQAEIDRLEAGGTSTSTMAEFLLLCASPVLVLAGAALLARAWTRRGRRGATVAR